MREENFYFIEICKITSAVTQSQSGLEKYTVSLFGSVVEEL